MKTDFDTWLAACAAAGKGGFVLPGASRGRKYVFGFSAPGDFTGSTLRAEVRASPDATGLPLASFTVTGPSYAAGVTSWVISLSAAATAGLPVDSAGDGVIYLPMEVLLDPAIGDEEPLFGAALPLLGRIVV